MTKANIDKMIMRKRLDDFKYIKIIFTVFAVVIVAISVYYSNKLADDMAAEERQRISLWAEATRRLVSDVEGSDLSFILKVIEGNNSIPVLVVDEQGEVVVSRNIEVDEESDKEFIEETIADFQSAHEPIVVEIDAQTRHYLYYDDSILLKKLAYYPYVQVGLVTVFFCLLLFFFASAKKSEQNRVWVGLSKETAHQLGTPISSLMAWVELIKETGMDPSYLPEMEKDVDRLKIIAERFSKVGSIPEREEVLLNDLLESSLSYMQTRTTSKIKIACSYKNCGEVKARLNAPLFQWVIENLCKNAIDAITGEGTIIFEVSETPENVILDVIDSGKGIPKSKFKTVFQPGYTTKMRGWGLGLSLVKRIVEEYHGGKIYVLRSELNQGTCFRVILNKM